MATDIEIDDSLYSRQRYVLGDSAMKRMAGSSVLVYGLGGLGVEIAKNIALAGVKTLTVQDQHVATKRDLGTQFFLTEEDVANSRNRAEASGKHLAELNPYVRVLTLTTGLEENADLSYLRNYQCVVFTEASLKLLIKVNQFCRSQNPPIKFILGEVYGVFCSAFCDFGDSFEVVDDNGEEPGEVFISNITKGNPGVVSCLENTVHSFEDGDVVTFREVNGMNALNGKQCQIRVISSSKFSVCDTSTGEFLSYSHGGIATQIKVHKFLTFKSLEDQLLSPDISEKLIDSRKMCEAVNIHIGYVALKTFQERHGRFPHPRCTKDSQLLLTIAEEVNKTLEDPLVSVKTQAENLLQQLAFTCLGTLAPLCAILGGILAQECLKSLTGKFTPLQQWFHLDAVEVIGQDGYNQYQLRGDRYDSLRVCIGDDLCTKLKNLRIFMVGCGAIGCEMLKNYALVGIGTGAEGLITVTDNDLIEKSNLNRQFLFRSNHIQQPKSTTAKTSVLGINPEMHIEAQQHKVCPQTESTVYTDHFFESQAVCVNALDNVETRRYMDSRCVTNQRPLLESGTQGAKGHVQVIVPHLTESYSDQRDPDERDVPYCTLKSFPATIEHCIQWARDKFESSFSQKPNLVNEFWSNNPELAAVIQRLKTGITVDGAVQVSKVSCNRPTTWEDCVRIARLKFEKYFNHKAKQLLFAFPMDTKLSDGSLFWQLPKRPPSPLVFDNSDQLHMSFVTSTARMYADIGQVCYSLKDLEPSTISRIVDTLTVPEFRPSNKTIVTDESVNKPENSVNTGSGDELLDSASRFESLVSEQQSGKVVSAMRPASFEKDDDSNGHIDFITAASNLRAVMYGIEPSDRLKTKRIAGRIIPAIATTTATVAGLVTVELIKVIKQCSLEELKNAFFNLGIPCMILSEPGPAKTMTIREGLTYTLWDRWEVVGSSEFTLQQFLDSFKDKYGFAATSVVMGVKMIYIPIMPGHKKRLSQSMLKLLKPGPGQRYADLVVMFEGEEDDVSGPPVRYFFNN